jgi:hypothetical protein
VVQNDHHAQSRQKSSAAVVAIDYRVATQTARRLQT